MAYRRGRSCDVQILKPCVPPDAVYIEAMNECIAKRKDLAISSWNHAKRVCHYYNYTGGLVEPNTEERFNEFSKFIKPSDKVIYYWIGLTYKDNWYYWWKHGNTLTEEMGKLYFGDDGNRGGCVEVSVKQKTWRRQRCNAHNHFFCATTSVLMPRKPKISVHNDNWRSVSFQPGSELKVSCEAVLSSRGDLRIIAFSFRKDKSIDFDSKHPKYLEDLFIDEEDKLCKRHGLLNVTVRITPDMDRWTVACVSFRDEAYVMCSRTDPYCHVAGAINVVQGVEPPTVIHEEGHTCGPSNSDPCSVQRTTYIDELNQCVFHFESEKKPWRSAIDTCHKFNGFLVEPNTNNRSIALTDYAIKYQISRFWIGLVFNDTIKMFLWAEYGNILGKDMFQGYRGTVVRNACILGLLQGSYTQWAPQNCTFGYPFFCGIPSVFMPGRPSITVDYANFSSLPLPEGSKLKVSCEAVLSQKGDLKILLLTNTTVRYFTFTDADVEYSSRLIYDEDGLCKRHGALTVTLRLTLEMDGKTLACISYQDGAFQMCSSKDRYCSAAGTLTVAEAPDTPLYQIIPWWIVAVFVLVISSCMLILARKVERLDDDGTEGSESFDYGEDEDDYHEAINDKEYQRGSHGDNSDVSEVAAAGVK